MSAFELYFHTIRHLRPVQIASRAWYRIHRPRADTHPAPQRRANPRPYVMPRPVPPSLIAPDTFRFLGVERRCATPADWAPADVSLLWAYNLHYFDDLNAADASARVDWHRALLARWVAENPPIPGAVGWDSYPLSRRVVNWVKWAARGHVLAPEVHQSLAVQARWLLGRLEYPILGNHLLANASALVHAGLYFQGPEAQQWHARGSQIVERELARQLLGDGGHFELSPMYHALVLEELLDLINLTGSYAREVPTSWLRAAARMQPWLNAMSHGDGDIAFFNDAAFGIAGTPQQLAAYARRLAIEPLPRRDTALLVLPESGYVRAALGDACLICDCAAVGPSYQPGHAHADTLSFELSLRGQRVLVNSGVSEYGTGAERQRQRGTAAHNTVLVNRADSSEVWAGFRVARRATALLRRAAQEQESITIEGSHDGYRRLPGRNVHSRRWRLHAGSLAIEDSISGAFREAEARFHLHPEVSARQDGRGAVVLECQGRARAHFRFEGAGSVEIERASWHPRFGAHIANQCISVRLAQPTLTSRLSWQS